MIKLLGKNFESHVYDVLKKQFSNYSIVLQLRLDSGIRPDFVMENDDKLAVVDAKGKERLTKPDVDQVIEYITELDADFGIIFVADFTEVPESIEEYAILNAIEIEYTDWRS